MAVKRHVQHIKSSQLNKVPTAQDLMYGEIAVNYAKDGETLFIKNNEGEIVSFPNSKIIEENEFVIASHLAELDDKISQSNNTFEEKERVIAEALVEHNDRLDELDTIVEDNEHVTAEALSQLRRDLDELDEITAAATYQNDLKIKRIEDLNISGQFEVTAQALSDLNERMDTVSNNNNEVLNLVNGNETVKPNVYTIVRSPNTNIEIDLKEEGFSASKTYKIEFGKENLPNIENVVWPENIIWEGNDEPDASDFSELGYDNWLVTIENGYLGSYKRYWTDAEGEGFGIKINTPNGQIFTLDCSEIPDGRLTNDIALLLKPMSYGSFITLSDCITSADANVFNYTSTNLLNVQLVYFDNCSFNDVGDSAFYGSTTNSTTSLNAGGDISIGCNGVTANIGMKTFQYRYGFNSITLGPDCVFTGDHLSDDTYSPFSNISVKTFNYDVPTSSRTWLTRNAEIDVLNIGPDVVDITSVFRTNTLLKKVNISEGLTTISDNAFYFCTGLTDITIPNTVTAINQNAFYQCTGLTSITIPNSVTTIGANAFWNCTGLTSVTIPNSVTTIGNYAFQACTGLTSATLNNSVTGEVMFSGCTSLTDVTIGNSVTKISRNMFQNCTALTDITIPGSVTRINEYAFSGCQGLTSFTCLATTPPTLDNANAFNNTNNCPIYVPAASVSAYKAASRWSTYSSRIQAIPSE